MRLYTCLRHSAIINKLHLNLLFAIKFLGSAVKRKRSCRNCNIVKRNASSFPHVTLQQYACLSHLPIQLKCLFEKSFSEKYYLRCLCVNVGARCHILVIRLHLLYTFSKVTIHLSNMY